MPKISKAVAEAKQAVDTHNDISFVVHFKGAIFLDSNDVLSGHIKDVRSYTLRGEQTATMPSEMISKNRLVGKRVSAGGDNAMFNRWSIAKALLGFYEGRNVNSSLTDAERAAVEQKYYKYCTPEMGSETVQSKFIQPPEGFEWTGRVKAYTRKKLDKDTGKAVLDDEGHEIVYHNYTFDGLWLNLVSEYPAPQDDKE